MAPITVDTAWSAAFISYIMKNNIPGFPVNESHVGYANSIRETPGNFGFKILDPKVLAASALARVNPNPGTPVGFTQDPLMPGDIIIGNRLASKNVFLDALRPFEKLSKRWVGVAHADIVVSNITYGPPTTSAKMIGGNLGYSVLERGVDAVRFPTNYPGGTAFVVLRPPRGAVEGIIQDAKKQKELWARRKVPDPNVLQYLSNYWSALDKQLEGISVTGGGNIVLATAYENETYIKTVPWVTGSTYLQDFRTRSEGTSPTVVFNEMQLTGELKLLSAIPDIIKQQDALVNNISAPVAGMLPSEQYFLVAQGLFEFFPDKMRKEIANNPKLPSEQELADDPVLATKMRSVNTNSHAWRAPGKLATTVDLTIPGIAGFSVGQVFWVDRIYDMYKQMGVFQMFSFSDSITIDRGWTTSLHARLNIMPESVMLNYLNKQK